MNLSCLTPYSLHPFIKWCPVVFIDGCYLQEHNLPFGIIGNGKNNHNERDVENSILLKVKRLFFEEEYKNEPDEAFDIELYPAKYWQPGIASLVLMKLFCILSIISLLNIFCIFNKMIEDDWAKFAINNVQNYIFSYFRLIHCYE